MHRVIAHTTKSTSVLFAAFAAMSFGCMADSGDEQLSTNLPLSFEEFKDSVYHEPWEDGVFIVNGDTPVVDEAALEEFFWDLQSSAGLIVNQTSGGDDCWKGSARLTINYCVSKSSFGSNYNRVVSAMNSATSAWEQAGDVNFVHVSSADGNCTQRTSGVVFDVRQVNSGQYLARAFFPSTSRSQRNILIDTSSFYWDTQSGSDRIPLEGVLRHELGHTLGFRHEHTRPESGVCFEDNNWRSLTSYDSASVMHYPQCNGTNSWSLTMTTKDKTGAELLYGRPGAGTGGQCGL